MQVFKTFFYIIKKNKMGLIVNFGVFILISILILSSNSQKEMENFTETTVPISIIDRDQTPTTTAITSYLSTIIEVVPLEDNIDILQDALYYRNVGYLLILPEGFTDNLYANKEHIIDTVKIPNSNSGMIVDLKMEQFLYTLQFYLSNGYDIEEALSSVSFVLSDNTEVTLKLDDNATEAKSSTYYFFALLPYIILALMINCISYMLITFNAIDLKKRVQCSALSLKNRNMQLTAASFVVAITLYVLNLIVGYFLCGSSLITEPISIYYFMNGAIMTIVGMSVAYFIGIIAKNEEQVNGMGNVISLGFSFLGGVFVPLYIMSKEVLVFCRFIPTYWYTKVNDILGSYTKLPASAKSEVFTGYLIQLLFATAIFSIALVISKQKAQRA